MKLSRLTKVELRDVWKHEANNFTKWLAKDENMQLLGEAISLDLVCIKREASVGKYSLDILAEDKDDGKTVIIENQLEMSDHDHLGKLITYASGYNASVVIWVCKEASEPHIKAIQWLNEETKNKGNCFLIELQIWRIDDSAPAPLFKVIESPNNWSNQLNSRNSKSNQKVSTEIDSIKYDFWQGLKDYCNDNNLVELTQAARPNSWYTVHFGTTKATVHLRLNTQTGRVNCELLIDDDKTLFKELYSHKEAIESKIGYELIWDNVESNKRSKIYISQEFKPYRKDTWVNNYDWLAKNIDIFKNTFSEYMRKY